MTRSLKRSTSKLFTSRQAAAILRLYVQQRLPALETARRLRLNESRVVRFLRQRRVMRPAGNPGTPRKLFPAIKEKLKRELATTINAILARKYGVSRERIGQIRKKLGAPPAREVHREWCAKARQQRLEQEQLEQRRRRELRMARKLTAIERLSERWKAGATLRELAAEYRTTPATIATSIQRLRKRYPDKFPYRVLRGERPRRTESLKLARQQAYARRLLAVNRLSERWKAGTSADELARESGVNPAAMMVRIGRLRRIYPEKFPYRFRRHSPCVPHTK